MKKIKIFDLKENIKTDKKILSSIKKILKNKDFIKGKQVKIFEDNFKKKIKSKYCVSTNSGTDALYLSLQSLNLKKQDEVITTSHSWISTSEAIINAGATPVFVDTGNDFNIDLDLVEKKINKKTKAILIVHLYGLPCNYDQVQKIKKKYKIKIIEDCAQAYLSKYRNIFTGNFGDIAAFSFFPTKNLGAYGDSGCVITNNKKIADRVRMLANHGGKNKSNFFLTGVNSRMDTIQAAILNQKIKISDTKLKKRNANAKIYRELLKVHKGITIPKFSKNYTHSFHLFTIKCKNRDKLKKYLQKNNIETGIYYSKLLPFYSINKKYTKSKNQFNTALKNHKEMLTLPVHENLEKQDIIKIANLIKKFFN